MFPPLVTAPANPLALEGLDVRVLPRSLGRMVGEGRVRDAVRARLLRPADLDPEEEGEVEALWIPLWRIEGSADGFGIGLVSRPGRRGPDVGVLGGGGKRPPRSPHGGRRRGPLLPSGQVRHHDGVVRVLARSGHSIDPAAKAKLPLTELVPFTDEAVDLERTVMPDVPREAAEAIATHTLERRGRPGKDNLFSTVDVRLRGALLCFYPVYVLRYRYAGEAVDGSGIFFAAVSGTTGKVVASHHPSAFKSAGSRLRSWFSGE
ncbi:MAG: hypothetical protein AB8I08_23115 [Sandaracinaceae bacterium]